MDWVLTKDRLPPYGGIVLLYFADMDKVASGYRVPPDQHIEWPAGWPENRQQWRESSYYNDVIMNDPTHWLRIDRPDKIGEAGSAIEGLRPYQDNTKWLDINTQDLIAGLNGAVRDLQTFHPDEQASTTLVNKIALHVTVLLTRLRNSRQARQ